MSDKISPFAVVKEAFSIGWARKWTFLGLLLVSSLPFLMLMGSSILVPSLSGVFFFLGFILHVLAVIFLLTTVNHLAVTMQRGAGVVLPERLPAAMGRVFLRVLVMWLVLMGSMLMLAVPVGVGMYFLMPQDGGEMSWVWMLLIIPVGIIGNVVMWGLILRLSVMIPGAAVGHVVGVREAFAVTRGHAWRMFWAMFILMVPVFVLVLVLEICAFTTWTDGSLGLVSILSMVAIFTVCVLLEIVMLVMNAVWYEKLRLRYEGGTVQPEPADAPGVGPYADVPVE
ncbi:MULTISPECIES: hypothetical protein [unclassified Pseudodesulfovibrio]|uniref:hypothetical protein n=1 Tax=unclassified Pseudodesulfovibrio TaxID=2661612 RepID=UPI000FEB73FB|nr:MULTISPECIES: hypothetical protein [unclassified Pseudodesulfovibrio]MCJ2165333.1 hypothetical protein [Pseudodesulfovibrio sp. S3-i]